jgi:hypothetical protein
LVESRVPASTSVKLCVVGAADAAMGSASPTADPTIDTVTTNPLRIATSLGV